MAWRGVAWCGVRTLQKDVIVVGACMPLYKVSAALRSLSSVMSIFIASIASWPSAGIERGGSCTSMS